MAESKKNNINESNAILKVENLCKSFDKEEVLKPRRKKKVYRRINITMDEEIAEMISIPAALHGGKTSRYIEDIVRKDLEKNLEKYKMIVKMREELD